MKLIAYSYYDAASGRGRNSQENPTQLVVFARISTKEAEFIGSEENRTKLFLETDNTVATP
ncbi:hypothetical protein QUA30_01730 [Microcoleus sp. Pol14C2]|uniref:hypothetical protein n=1 Tax=unclassified Microcoleus TaxID=2642155 RepID=UPI002FD5BD22